MLFLNTIMFLFNVLNLDHPSFCNFITSFFAKLHSIQLLVQSCGYDPITVHAPFSHHGELLLSSWMHAPFSIAPKFDTSDITMGLHEFSQELTWKYKCNKPQHRQNNLHLPSRWVYLIKRLQLISAAKTNTLWMPFNVLKIREHFVSLAFWCVLIS